MVSFPSQFEQWRNDETCTGAFLSTKNHIFPETSKQKGKIKNKELFYSEAWFIFGVGLEKRTASPKIIACLEFGSSILLRHLIIVEE